MVRFPADADVAKARTARTPVKVEDCAATGAGEPVRAKFTPGDAVEAGTRPGKSMHAHDTAKTGLPVSPTRSTVKLAGAAG